MIALDRSQTVTIAGVTAVVLCMVAPLFVVRGLELDATTQEIGGASAATAALGALFRSGARQLLRSTLMTAIRATTRTASRRAMRSLLPMLVRLLLPSLSIGEAPTIPFLRYTWARLLLGFVGLAASFAGVMALQTPETRAALVVGLPLAVASALAAAPTVLHYLVLWTTARLTGIGIRLHVPFDGILVQMYFTAAASFLPILTDIELSGPRRARAICASAVLGAFVLGHYVSAAVAASTGAPTAQFMSGVFLIYAFISAFPLHPLDGKDIWDFSKLLWLVLWLGVTGLFMQLPGTIYSIL